MQAQITLKLSGNQELVMRVVNSAMNLGVADGMTMTDRPRSEDPIDEEKKPARKPRKKAKVRVKSIRAKAPRRSNLKAGDRVKAVMSSSEHNINKDDTGTVEEVIKSTRGFGAIVKWDRSEKSIRYPFSKLAKLRKGKE